MKNDDARLVESVLAGNLDDYRKLVDAYQLSAEQWAFRQVRNISDAEEIAQEAFVEAYFRLDTLRQAEKFAGWLHRIVVNTAVSWLRRRKCTVSFDETASISGGGELSERYNRSEAPTPHDLLGTKRSRKICCEGQLIPFLQHIAISSGCSITMIAPTKILQSA